MRHLLLCSAVLLVVTACLAQGGQPPERGVPAAPQAVPAPHVAPAHVGSPAPAATPPPAAPAPAVTPVPPVATAPETSGLPVEVEQAQRLVAPLGAAVRGLGRPVTFLAYFLLIGSVFRGLVRRVTAGGATPGRPFADAPDVRTQRRAAIGDLLVWIAALAIACEAIGFSWFQPLGTLFMGLLHLIGSLLVGALWLLAAAIIAYAISPRGQDIVLGVAAWLYLRYKPQPGLAQEEFDLGEGVRGRYVRSDWLHSFLQGSDGREYHVPNVWLMRHYFRWDSENLCWQERPAAGPVEKAQ